VKKFAATTPIYYRADIQMLRGLAVCLVVIYHAGISFSGGFIGVDMFFTISGYVVTQMLMREKTASSSNLLTEFYLRRVRRLLPALAVLVISTLVLSVVFMSPFGEQQEVANTAQASTFFATNLYFFFQNNYWALDDNPLRHLWSLAVEEQFYLIFPLLILMVRKSLLVLKPKKALLVFGALGLISFIGSYFLSLGYRFTPLPIRFAFYGTPWRFWEFLAGSIAAVVGIRVQKTLTSNLLSLLAVVCIVWSAFSLNSYTPIPGIATVPPVLGTAFLLLNNSSITKSQLSSILKPLERLGDVSYAWYLWHWPLLVFSRKAFPDSSVYIPFATVLLSLIIAQISTTYIENPIRRCKDINKKSTIKIGVVCTIVPLILTFVFSAIAGTGLGLNDVSSVTVNSQSRYARSSGCTRSEQNLCDFSRDNSKPLLLLVGDSAAGSISDGVSEAAQRAGLDFIVSFSSFCPFQFRPNEKFKGCKEFAEFRESLVRDLKPELLVIANMTDLYVASSPENGAPGNTNAAGREPRTPSEALEFWLANFEEKIVNDLLKQKTIVILQPPISQFRNPTLLNPELNQVKSPRLLSKLRDRNVNAESNLLKTYSNITTFDPATILCTTKMCDQLLNGESLYLDSRHLTVLGSTYLSDAIFEKITSALVRQ